MKTSLRNLSIALLSTALLATSNSAFSREVNVNINEENQSLFSGWFGGDKSGVAAVDNALYLDKCGSCHFAYQPGLLPIGSWEKTMSNLGSHFDKSIKLTDEEDAQIRNFLLDSAAGRTNRKISVKFIRSLHDGQVPLRISEIPYFIEKHHKLSAEMVQDNAEVGSLNHCDACHTEADKGIFDGSTARIPGFKQK
jgi:hypothetical protein